MARPDDRRTAGPTLADATYLAHLRDDAATLARAARVDLGAEVPACPGWQVEKLVDHVGKIHRWALAQCEAAPASVRRSEVPARAPHDDPVEWFEAGASSVARFLEEADLDAPTQTWAGEQDRRWWLRRLANETAVHRWDAESATTTAQTIDAALAADGIDEILEWFAPLLLDRSSLDSPVTIHLHATDAVPDHPGEWFVEVDADRFRWEHRHAKGDVAVRGSTSDLLLTMWNRMDGRVEVLGDEQVFHRVVRALVA